MRMKDVCIDRPTLTHTHNTFFVAKYYRAKKPKYKVKQTLQQYGTVSTHTKNMMSTVQYQNPYPTIARSYFLQSRRFHSKKLFQIHSCCSKTPVQYISRIPTNTELPQKQITKVPKSVQLSEYPLTQLPLKKKSLTFFTADRPVQRTTTTYYATALTKYYDISPRS